MTVKQDRRHIDPNPDDASKLDVTTICPVCNCSHTVTVDSRAYAQWRAGKHIQDVMPELSVVQRELLITGIDGGCWNRMFR